MARSSASAIIIAAGMGRRLLPLTQHTPKCMLSVGRQTILEQQVAVLRQAGITRISIIRGHLKEKILVDQPVSFFDNPFYRHNNILESLFCAADAIAGDVIITYSDIIFDANIVNLLLNAAGKMTIAVDVDWRGQYVGRHLHPVEEAEKAIWGRDGHVLKIGKHLDSNAPGLTGEFIGMLRLSAAGAEIFKAHFKRCRDSYVGRQFQRAASLSEAYLTDFLQELVDQGEAIYAATFSGGWMEIDTIEDLERARRRYNSELTAHKTIARGR